MIRRPKARANLEIRETGDEVLVHDAAHDQVHVLNRTAGLVLGLCDGTRSAGDIARSVGAAFDVEAPIVARDVDAVLHDFFAARLIAPA